MLSKNEAVNLWRETYENAREDCEEMLLIPLERKIREAIAKRLDWSVRYDIGEFYDDASKRLVNCAIEILKEKGFSVELNPKVTSSGSVNYQLAVSWR